MKNKYKTVVDVHLTFVEYLVSKVANNTYVNYENYVSV